MTPEDLKAVAARLEAVLEPVYVRVWDDVIKGYQFAHKTLDEVTVQSADLRALLSASAEKDRTLAEANAQLDRYDAGTEDDAGNALDLAGRISMLYADWTTAADVADKAATAWQERAQAAESALSHLKEEVLSLRKALREIAEQATDEDRTGPEQGPAHLWAWAQARASAALADRAKESPSVVESAARVASDLAASETPCQSEGGGA